MYNARNLRDFFDNILFLTIFGLSEGSKTSPDGETGTAVNFLSKLRPTGGQKPWEKGLAISVLI